MALLFASVIFFVYLCSRKGLNARQFRTSSHCVDIYKSKGDTTMSEITQQNLYLLLPFKVSWVADMLAEDEHISTIEAIRRVYSSAMYKQLEQESTKRWHEGPVSLYQTI